VTGTGAIRSPFHLPGRARVRSVAGFPGRRPDVAGITRNGRRKQPSNGSVQVVSGAHGAILFFYGSPENTNAPQ
jgi:hypothetical protein